MFFNTGNTKASTTSGNVSRRLPVSDVSVRVIDLDTGDSTGKPSEETALMDGLNGGTVKVYVREKIEYEFRKPATTRDVIFSWENVEGFYFPPINVNQMYPASGSVGDNIELSSNDSDIDDMQFNDTIGWAFPGWEGQYKVDSAIPGSIVLRNTQCPPCHPILKRPQSTVSGFADNGDGNTRVSGDFRHMKVGAWIKFLTSEFGAPTSYSNDYDFEIIEIIDDNTVVIEENYSSNTNGITQWYSVIDDYIYIHDIRTEIEKWNGAFWEAVDTYQYVVSKEFPDHDTAGRGFLYELQAGTGHDEEALYRITHYNQNHTGASYIDAMMRTPHIHEVPTDGKPPIIMAIGASITLNAVFWDRWLEAGNKYGIDPIVIDVAESSQELVTIGKIVEANIPRSRNWGYALVHPVGNTVSDERPFSAIPLEGSVELLSNLEGLREQFQNLLDLVEPNFHGDVLCGGASYREYRKQTYDSLELLEGANEYLGSNPFNDYLKAEFFGGGILVKKNGRILLDVYGWMYNRRSILENFNVNDDGIHPDGVADYDLLNKFFAETTMKHIAKIEIEDEPITNPIILANRKIKEIIADGGTNLTALQQQAQDLIDYITTDDVLCDPVYDATGSATTKADYVTNRIKPTLQAQLDHVVNIFTTTSPWTVVNVCNPSYNVSGGDFEVINQLIDIGSTLICDPLLNVRGEDTGWTVEITDEGGSTTGYVDTSELEWERGILNTNLWSSGTYHILATFTGLDPAKTYEVEAVGGDDDDDYIQFELTQGTTASTNPQQCSCWDNDGVSVDPGADPAAQVTAVFDNVSPAAGGVIEVTASPSTLEPSGRFYFNGIRIREI